MGLGGEEVHPFLAVKKPQNVLRCITTQYRRGRWDHSPWESGMSLSVSRQGDGEEGCEEGKETVQTRWIRGMTRMRMRPVLFHPGVDGFQKDRTHQQGIHYVLELIDTWERGCTYRACHPRVGVGAASTPNTTQTPHHHESKCMIFWVEGVPDFVARVENSVARPRSLHTHHPINIQ